MLCLYRCYVYFSLWLKKNWGLDLRYLIIEQNLFWFILKNPFNFFLLFFKYKTWYIQKNMCNIYVRFEVKSYNEYHWLFAKELSVSLFPFLFHRWSFFSFGVLFSSSLSFKCFVAFGFFLLNIGLFLIMKFGFVGSLGFDACSLSTIL